MYAALHDLVMLLEVFYVDWFTAKFWTKTPPNIDTVQSRLLRDSRRMVSFPAVQDFPRLGAHTLIIMAVFCRLWVGFNSL